MEWIESVKGGAMEQFAMTVLKNGAEERFPVAAGTTIADALRGAGLFLPSPCGGRGVCGQCRVRADGGLTPPSEEEAALLGTLREGGTRLACRAVVTGDCHVEWTPAAQIEAARGDALRMGKSGDRLFSRCGAAVDIGTTTLCARIYTQGGCVEERCARNPQVAFGADVISRVGAAMAGQGGALSKAVVGAITMLLEEACAAAGVSLAAIDALLCTGNTAMLYLLTGRDPSSLAAAPFCADCLFDETVSSAALGFPFDAACYLPRCISAFVGADVLCAILASGMTDRRETSMLADVGTNGEIALWHGCRLTCCSTAAGPAFEGAELACGQAGIPGAIDAVRAVDGRLSATTIGGLPAIGVCGSGVLDAIAAMRTLGVLDESGRIVRPDATMDGARVYLSGDVYMTQRDVRAVQLAKGAVRAGIDTLLQHASLSAADADAFYIAGGFGSFLNAESAAAIGMFPAVFPSRAQVLGNGALTGASMLLFDRALNKKASALATAAVCRDLSADACFQDAYIENMSFPAL